MSVAGSHQPNSATWGAVRPVRGRSDRKSLLNRRDRLLTPMIRWAMAACSLVALASSSYLAWASLTASSVAGCGGGSVFDCHHVLHSRWSSVLSVPVSIPAMLVHASLLGLLFWHPATKHRNRRRLAGIAFAALAAGAAAVWFIGLQIFAIGEYCPYCLVAHASGIILAGIVIWKLPLTKRSMARIATGAAGCLAVLISLQMFNSVPDTHQVIEHEAVEGSMSAPAGSTDSSIESGESGDSGSGGEEMLFEAPQVRLDIDRPNSMEARWQTALATAATGWFQPTTLIGAQTTASGDQGDAGDSGETKAKTRPLVYVLGNVKLDAAAWPIVGDPQAEMKFVELFDYTCPHCQRTHASLQQARQRYGDRLAILTLPLPLDGECNPAVGSTSSTHREACELAKLAIAFWMVDREKFEDFHDYLFRSKPRYSQALGRARTLVDGEALQKALDGPTPGEYIDKHVTLYRKAGSGTIPIILFSKAKSVGAVSSPQAMIRLIEQHLR